MAVTAAFGTVLDTLPQVLSSTHGGNRMAKTLAKDNNLGTRAARLRLAQQRKPHWRAIGRGRHLGYYRGSTGGTWIARIYRDGRYHEMSLGAADDSETADGKRVLSFEQATAKAAQFFERITDPAIAPLEARRDPTTPYTVGDACADYLEWYKAHRKDYRGTHSTISAHILPKLKNRPVTALTAREIRRWMEGLSSTPPRVRTGKFEKEQKHRETFDQRARHSTVNRVLTVLKAALNHAWREGYVPSDTEWRRVKPFAGADAAKIRFLTLEECKRLVNACESDFRPLVQAALLTGARYGELTRLVVNDFHPDSKTLLVREAKAGKPRHIPLTDEANSFFEQATAGKEGEALIFMHPEGGPWGDKHQHRRMREASERAKLKPPASFHLLRHAFASFLAAKGVSLQIIAEALGHSDTRITHKHYAHLQPSAVAAALNVHLPAFGFAHGKVRRLARSAATKQRGAPGVT